MNFNNSHKEMLFFSYKALLQNGFITAYEASKDPSLIATSNLAYNLWCKGHENPIVPCFQENKIILNILQWINGLTVERFNNDEYLTCLVFTFKQEPLIHNFPFFVSLLIAYFKESNTDYYGNERSSEKEELMCTPSKDKFLGELGDTIEIRGKCIGHQETVEKIKSRYNFNDENGSHFWFISSNEKMGLIVLTNNFYHIKGKVQNLSFHDGKKWTELDLFHILRLH